MEGGAAVKSEDFDVIFKRIRRDLGLLEKRGLHYQFSLREGASTMTMTSKNFKVKRERCASSHTSRDGGQTEKTGDEK